MSRMDSGRRNWIIGGSTFVLGIGWAALHDYYDRTLPEIADLPSGRIYSLNDHGHVVFLTLGQLLFLNAVIPILWLVVAALSVWSSRPARTPELPNRTDGGSS